MPKINVYLSDELAEAVKDADIPVSAVCQGALELAVRQVAAVRHAVTADLDAGRDPTASLQRFTDRARNAVRIAVARANGRGAAAVSSADLLAGLVEEGGNLAVGVLRAIEIDPREALARADDLPAEEASDTGSGLRFGASVKAALFLTVSTAISLGHNYVGCEHLLLGLVSEPDGAAGQALRSLGGDPKTVRRTVVGALSGYVQALKQQPGQQDPKSQQGGAMAAVGAAIRQELAPLIQRVEALERRVTEITGPA